MPAENSIAVVQGSTTVTGNLTSFVGAEWDTFFARGRAIPIDLVVSTSLIVLKLPWPDATAAEIPEEQWAVGPYGPYWNSNIAIGARVNDLIEKIRRGLPLKFDASGSLSERTTYDNQPPNFLYLATDPLPFSFYIKNADGSWSQGNPIQPLAAETTEESEAARDIAVAAQIGAVAARDVSVAAKDTTLAARDITTTARDLAVAKADVATAKAVIATDQAAISTAQAVISTAKAAIATTQAGISISQATLATDEANRSDARAADSNVSAIAATGAVTSALAALADANDLADSVHDDAVSAAAAIEQAEDWSSFAQGWATTPENTAVPGGGGEYSSKHYAAKAAAYAATISPLFTTIDYGFITDPTVESRDYGSIA